ncbi:hypothetical protein [Spartinivicinus poritis]|uniref:Uncharacterized protein n=1 Tax=Spartinivicinus poritis TaxID=2994640 RepID=A0ABT5UFB4_9GAMM|nr:hypothetical protein [Spartinivicinus sp. A2-2]MDE1465038.1 hypothetical protein [Spartinivicinus sp. A2-2]
MFTKNHDVVLHEDHLQFTFPLTMMFAVKLPPAQIKACTQSTMFVDGKLVCVVGDEKKVSIACTYSIPSHPSPGEGTVTILSLDDNQNSSKTWIEKNQVILRGTTFQALLTPKPPGSKAKNPAIPLPSPLNEDPSPWQLGTGRFIANSRYVRFRSKA